MIFLRHLGRLAGDLVRHPLHSGQWWLPVVIVYFLLAAVLAAFVKSATPVTVYVLF